MFRRLPDLAGEPLRFTVDGREVAGRRGDTVASALLANGVETCRTTPISGAPRAPYCLMGVCFECLVTIDGTGSRQGCLVALAEGMRVETQRGARAVSPPLEGEVSGVKRLTEGDSLAGLPPSRFEASASTRPSPPGKENGDSRS